MKPKNAPPRAAPARLHRERGRTVCLDANSTEPPTEFILFRIGTNPTENGTFYLTADDAKGCVAAQAEYGNDLSVDWGHGASTEEDGQPRPAAGWIGGLEARSDGLYAVRVSWTPLAAQMIRNREQRYTSPMFLADEDSHITKILNAALTIVPATRDLQPLVASIRTKGIRMSKMVKAEDVQACSEELAEMAAHVGSDKMKTLSDKLAKMADDAEDPTAGDDPDADPASPAGKKAEAPAKSSDDNAVAAETLSSDDAAVTELAEMSALAKLARDITGKTKVSEVRGTLLAMKDGKEQVGDVQKLHSRLAELEAHKVSTEVAEVVRLGIKAGKLRPAQREWAIKLGISDLDSLRTFIKESATVSSAATEAKAADGGVPKTVVQLSKAEEDVIKASGINRDAYLAKRSTLG